MNSLEIMPGLSISNDLCAILGRQRAVVISDLHIGYESVMEDSGLHLPRIQTASMRESLLRIMERHAPEQVIILGDLKHEFSRNLAQEWNEVREFLSLITERAEITVIRGNHDNYLATISSKLGLTLMDEYEADGIHFAHGHQYIAKRPLVIGHEHPSVRLFDSVGAYLKMPCFVHLPKQQILVVPAFSPLASGTSFNSIEAEDCLSPILKRADLGEARAYACSEIGLMSLGKLSSLGKGSR